MNEKKRNRREWVKTAAIVFLSVMLVLTFFSNTIMNYSLPEVATQYVQSGTITLQVRGTGTVESGNLYNVIISESRKVTSVAVRVGDSVQIGDVICYLEDVESNELVQARKELEAAQQAYDLALLSGNYSVSQMQTGTNNISVSGFRNQLIAAQKEVDAIQDKIDAMMPAYNLAKDKLDTAQAALDEATTEVKRINSWIQYNATVTTGDAPKSLQDQYQEAYQIQILRQNEVDSVQLEFQKQQQALSDLQDQLSTAEANVRQLSSDISAALDLGKYYDVVVSARENVERLEEKAIGATITADIAGRITSVSVIAGGTTAPDMTIATIQPEGQGYTLSFSVTAEQANRISIGDPAELVNSWWYYDVTATVASIRPDPSDPNRSRLVTFNLTGDLTAGQNLSLQVGSRSQNYNMVVPNSAIREDNNGKFILVVEGRQSPLGTRYYAVRYDIEVLASDDTQSAISGPLNGYEYVITTSTKPVEAGQLVRLPD